jgi:cation transport protein ChaC
MDLWVFGYGSLMWRPNFRYAEAHDAVLEGGSRALCVYSVVHRGTHNAPGLVLGLDRGGVCHGIAYRVPSIAARETRHYLKRRENVTNTYVAVTRPVRLVGRDREVLALCYMVNRWHPQYAGGLTLERQAQLVRRSRGASGRNIDYVVNTVEHLRGCGVYDPGLERLMALLGFARHRRP